MHLTLALAMVQYPLFPQTRLQRQYSRFAPPVNVARAILVVVPTRPAKEESHVPSVAQPVLSLLTHPLCYSRETHHSLGSPACPLLPIDLLVESSQHRPLAPSPGFEEMDNQRRFPD